MHSGLDAALPPVVLHFTPPAGVSSSPAAGFCASWGVVMPVASGSKSTGMACLAGLDPKTVSARGNSGSSQTA
jgi:hypothetical protein